MESVDLIQLGTSTGKYKGTLEVAKARTGDLFLTLLDEEPPEPQKVEGSFYLTQDNAKRLAKALVKAAGSG
jgi:hypothetical protein